MGKSLAVLFCVFLLLNSLGCGTNDPTSQSTQLAAKIVAESHRIQSGQAQPQDISNLANDLERYVNLAEQNGSLARSEVSIRRNMDRIRPDGRQALMNNSIKALLLQAAENLRFIAATQQAHVDNPASANVRPNPSRCSTLEGSFLAIAAIGAVASLGGVDPLGDLLGAIGAVGAFATWAIC